MSVCVCVCVVRGFMWFMRTQICIITWVMTEVLQFEGVYEDTAYVPVIQKAKKHTKWCFFENLKMHTVLL